MNKDALQELHIVWLQNMWYMIHVAEYIPELSSPDPVKPDTSHYAQE